MNKLLLGAISLAVAINLNATTFATVDGKDITEMDLAPLLQGMPAGFKIDELPYDTKKQLIDKGIQLYLLTQNAIKSGIENDEVYKKELAVAKDTLAFRVWQVKEFEKTTVSEDEIKAFYDKNKASFVEPEQFNVKHILVKTEKEAKDIIATLSKLKGEALNKKFDELAKSKSIEPAAKQTGGDLGWFAQGQMVKEFGDASKALKKGELSKKPVKTQFGYHVIFKIDEKPAKQLSLADVSDYIKNILKEDKYKVQIEEKAKELESKAKIEYTFSKPVEQGNKTTK